MSNRRDVIAAYTTYLEAFMASDEVAIHNCFVWPCAFVLDGKTVMLDKFPFSPIELRKQKNWATSVDSEIDMVAASESKAHVLLRNCARVREDGSLIEEVSAFYALTKTELGWKIFAMSGIEFPAGAGSR